MTTTSKIVQNALDYAARNDKWIDDFHVIITTGKPDPALVEALKKKSAAWKVLKRNFSDKAADEAHTKAEDEAFAIAKRFGAKWIQQGAVTKIVMPDFKGNPFFNSVVAANAVCAANANIETLVADLDKGKYDSLQWMPKVVGRGSLYPDGMKFPSGLGYDDEDKVRTAWHSGKYASVIAYKGGSKRGEFTINATAKNANEPLIRFIKSNIQTKFPQSSLEGYTDGVTSLIERGNGKITILADRKARPALDQLKARFEPDYIFAFVDYGRGKTGFTMTPRAHTQRGEFKVANAKAYDRNGHGLKEGDIIDTPKGLAVILQFKQSTSNPERRYASYVGVSYDPEKKVVQEWLMTGSRGEIRATVQNAKFAVTAKSGASTVIEAPNYAAAEKEAKRRFGAGCIVDVVGNAELASLDKLLKKNGITREEFDKMIAEMKRKGAKAVHFIRGKDGKLKFKADGTTIGNAKFKVGDKVWVPAKQKIGVIRGVSATGNQYDVEFIGGGGSYVNEEELKFLQFSVRTTNAVVAKALNAAVAGNAAVDVPVKFEVGKVYREPWDKNWLAKVLSRTDSSIKVAIKSAKDTTWHGKDEQVTLRINPTKSVEQGAEVAKGWDWEFWADVKA